MMKRMGRKIRQRSIKLLIIVSMLAVYGFGFTEGRANAEASLLKDISNSYSQKEIEALVEAGILSGYGDGSFKPEKMITRAEIAAVIAKLLDLPMMPNKAAVFADVEPSAWYSGYIGALVSAGITSGTASDRYDPRTFITREELAVIVIRALGLGETALKMDLQNVFTDSELVSNWAKPYLSLAFRIGLIRGIEDANGNVMIQPKHKAERQAAARLAYELMKNKEFYWNEAQRLVLPSTSPSPVPSAVSSATPTSVPTSTNAPTSPPTVSPTPTPTPTATPTPTPTPTATPIPTPEPPIGLNAVGGDTVVTLNWEASVNAASYTVYQSTVSGTTFTEAASNLTATNAAITGLTNGTPYYFIVKAVNESGESEASAEVSATPQVAAPAAPVLNGAVSGDMQVTLSWTSVPKATSYIIYKSTTQGTDYVEATSGITDTSATITGLGNGTTYYFVVRAVNAGGGSSVSNERAATPVMPPPTAPTNIRVTNGYQQTTVQWNASTRAASYNVYMGTVSGGEYDLIASNVIGLTYTVTGLTTGVQYFVVIKAVNASGESAASSEASAASYLQTPYGFSHYNYSSDIMLYWTKPANATRVKIFWATSSDGVYTEYYPQFTLTSSVSFRPVTSGTTYYFRYKAVYPDGESDFSSTYNVTFN